jgi:hypothetical protein
MTTTVMKKASTIKPTNPFALGTMRNVWTRAFNTNIQLNNTL